MVEQAPTSKIDFNLKYPDLFTATVGKVTQVQVPKLQFLTTTGTGSHDQKAFQVAAQGLHGIAFALKFRIKRRQVTGFTDYLMPPVEAIWKNLRKKPELREWKAFLLQPVTVTSALLYEVTDIATMRHPDTPLPEVKLETCSEGACLQTLHRGPYALLDTAETAIHSYAKEWGLKIEKTRHEIYLNDPRKTKEADLETIIRMQVATK